MEPRAELNSQCHWKASGHRTVERERFGGRLPCVLLPESANRAIQSLSFARQRGSKRCSLEVALEIRGMVPGLSSLVGLVVAKW